MTEILEGVGETFIQRHGSDQVEISDPYEISEVMDAVCQHEYNYDLLDDLLFISAFIHNYLLARFF